MSDKHREPAPTPEEQLETPLNTARGQTDGPLHRVPPAGDAPQCAKPPINDNYLSRTQPGQQKFAKAFLAGTAPGIQQRYAPNAQTSDVEGWVEDDETVERLARWREEAPYG